MLSTFSLFLLIRTTVWSVGSNSSEFIEIEILLSSLIIKRPNYPFNCFTLDISQNQEVRKKGVRAVIFRFYHLVNTSVQILLEDRRLACTRQIRENVVYFSGSNIKLDLGDIKLKYQCYIKQA